MGKAMTGRKYCWQGKVPLKKETIGKRLTSDLRVLQRLRWSYHAGTCEDCPDDSGGKIITGSRVSTLRRGAEMGGSLSKLLTAGWIGQKVSQKKGEEENLQKRRKKG